MRASTNQGEREARQEEGTGAGVRKRGGTEHVCSGDSPKIKRFLVAFAPVFKPASFNPPTSPVRTSNSVPSALCAWCMYARMCVLCVCALCVCFVCVCVYVRARCGALSLKLLGIDVLVRAPPHRPPGPPLSLLPTPPDQVQHARV
jgi:hypothetical protein